LTQRSSPPVQRKVEALRQQVLRMGHLAEAILDKSIRCALERDAVQAASVAADDLPIDRLDVEIDRAVLEMLALQAPVAQDLREVIAMKTAATDLERVGDLARNIAKSAIRLSGRPIVSPPARLESLASASQRVLKQSLLAFADYDAALARHVIATDDLIDDDEDAVVLSAIAEIKVNPESTEQEVDYILIAKHLERVGDHATNIAEDVVLVIESVNLKHAEKLVS
jgi:phosphate transport system protein